MIDSLKDTDGLIDRVAIEFADNEYHYWDITGKDIAGKVDDRMHYINLVKKAIENAESLEGTLHIRTNNDYAFRLVEKHNTQRKYKLVGDYF